MFKANLQMLGAYADLSMCASVEVDGLFEHEDHILCQARSPSDKPVECSDGENYDYLSYIYHANAREAFFKHVISDRILNPPHKQSKLVSLLASLGAPAHVSSQTSPHAMCTTSPTSTAWYRC